MFFIYYSDLQQEYPDERAIMAYVALLWQSLVTSQTEQSSGIMKFRKVVENVKRRRLSVQIERRNEYVSFLFSFSL